MKTKALGSPVAWAESPPGSPQAGVPRHDFPPLRSQVWKLFSAGDPISPPHPSHSHTLWFSHGPSLSFSSAPHCLLIFSSLSRDQTCAPCVGSMVFQPLDDQGSPMEPYIFQSWGTPGQFTGLSGEIEFPHLQMRSGWAGSPLGTTVPERLPPLLPDRRHHCSSREGWPWPEAVVSLPGRP